MAPDDFQFLARLLCRRSGLSLTLDKRALIERQLAPVMRRFDFKDAAALICELRLGREALAAAVTEAVTVNDSSFFRDRALFANFAARVLPRLLAARGTTSGCASGRRLAPRFRKPIPLPSCFRRWA